MLEDEKKAKQMEYFQKMAISDVIYYLDIIDQLAKPERRPKKKLIFGS